MVKGQRYVPFAKLTRLLGGAASRHCYLIPKKSPWGRGKKQDHEKQLLLCEIRPFGSPLTTCANAQLAQRDDKRPPLLH